MRRHPRHTPMPRIRLAEDYLSASVPWMIHRPPWPNFPPPYGGQDSVGPLFLQNAVQVRRYDCMVDWIGDTSLWHPCLHHRIRGFGGVQSSCDWADYVDWQGQPVDPAPIHVYPEGDTPAYCAVSASDLLRLVPVVHRSITSDLSKSVLKRATAQIPAVVDLGNFLLELREGIKGILPSLKSFKSCLGNLYLGLKFGTESFLRDLASLTTVWSKVTRRLKYLKRHNGHETWVRGWRDTKRGNPLDSSNYDIPEDVILDADPNGSAHVVVRLHVVPESIIGEIHVNILTWFLLQGLETFWGKVDAFGAALGLNNPAKIAWNHAKMSWLVEYFVNVSPYLDKLAGAPFKGASEIRSAWTSHKVKFQVEVYAGRRGVASYTHPIVGAYSWSTDPVGTYVVTEYSRNPGLELTEDELVSCDLTDSQKLILIALAESRLSWGNTKWTKWAIRKWGPWGFGERPNLRMKNPPRFFRKLFGRRKS